VAGGTLPAKMLEAFAAGVPVVAAIRGEGAAMLEGAHAGIAVPVGDAAALAEALRRVTHDAAQREAMRAAGRAYAEANLSPARVTAAYAAIIERLAGRPLAAR
jgi:glycosyltransferase involved in cell wall biosynthesis